MYRILILLLISCFSGIDLFAQTLLNNQEVYDLKVGEALKYKLMVITWTDDTPGANPPPTVYEKFRYDSILSKTLLPGNQTVSCFTKRISNLTEPNGIDSTFNISYPFNNEPVKCPFFQTTIAVFDTLAFIGQPGNIPATGFSLSNGYDSINKIESQTVIFIKGLGGPFLLVGENPGIGSTKYFGSFQLSKPGQEPVPILFSITESKRNISTLGVFPNPCRQQIQLPESALGSTYQMYNLQGKPIKSGTVENSVLDVANLQPGLYQLVVSSPKNGERKTVRIVKE